MPRLRDTKSGAVVSVSAETAARLGGEWELLVEKPTKKAAAKKAASKSATKE